MTYALIAHTPATLSATLGAHTITVILIAGAFIFGLSGGLAGALKGLDFFGVLVLAGVVGLSGGALRDIFLGIPAVVIFDWRIVLSVLCSGVLAFFLYHPLQRWTNSIQIIDALGLSIFSVIGTDIALHHHAGAVASAALGMLTGIGGGAVRDIVLREVPAVLQGGLYALPALFSSLVVVIGYETNHISLLWYSLAGLACLVLRLIGIFFDVNLPKAS